MFRLRNIIEKFDKDSYSADESHFLPSNPTKRQKEVAKYLMQQVKEHRTNPDIKVSGSLDRSEISDVNLSSQDLKDAGFKSALIAVPETGQSQLTTYRHPRNGLHFHKHPASWLFHEDKYPSLNMVIEKYKQDNPNYTFKDLAKFTLTKAIPESAGHIVNEGLPGWVSFATGKLRGSAGIKKHEHANFLKALKNTGVTSAIMTGGELLLNKDVGVGKSFVKNVGTTTGFVAGHEIAKRVLNKLIEIDDRYKQPSLAATGLLVGLPILSALAARKGTASLIEELED